MCACFCVCVAVFAMDSLRSNTLAAVWSPSAKYFPAFSYGERKKVGRQMIRSFTLIGYGGDCFTIALSTYRGTQSKISLFVFNMPFFDWAWRRLCETGLVH